MLVRRKKLCVVILFCGLIGLGTAGCGVYSASSGRVDDSLRQVAVPYLENGTSEPNIGVELTDAIIRALQEDNTLKVVEEGYADTILSGKVANYRVREVAAQRDLTVNEYQVQIRVVLTFQVRATGEKLFAKKQFSGTGNYVLGDMVLSEESARAEAAEEIVRDVLAGVVEEW